MGYDVLHVTGDGDCFFHAVAVHLQIRNDNLKIPLAWILEKPGLFPPSYHYKFRRTAVQVREVLAEWLAKKILGTDLATLVDAWQSIFNIRDVKDLASVFKDPDFSVVSEQDWLQGVPDPLGEIWKQDLTPEARRIYMSFYIYWYTKSYNDVDGDPWWSAVCEWMNVPDRYCIWGHFDTNHPTAQGANAGFAARAVLEEFHLNLQPVAGDADWANTLIFPDYSVAHILHSPGHFDPIIWCSFQFPSTLNHQYAMEEFSVLDVREVGEEKTASRHLPNSVRDAFMLGFVVWNVNHLAKTPKNAFVNLPPESIERDETKQPDETPFNPFAMEQKEVVHETKDKEKTGDFKAQKEESGMGEFGGKKYDSEEDYYSSSEDDDEYLEEEDLDYEEEPERAPKLIDDTKNQLKVNAICDLFDKQGAWMDLLGLNEVNLGIDRIENASGGRYTVHRGPLMIAVGAKRPSTQKEYYPLLINNKTRGFKIDYVDCIAVSADGQYKNVNDNSEYRWIKVVNVLARDTGTAPAKKNLARGKKQKVDVNEQMVQKFGEGWWKNLPNHRPVVVHRLDVDGIGVNVAIVHTTPGGTEFERILVYSQLREFFARARKGEYDRNKGDLWLIGGDFYLYSESVVIGPGQEYGSNASWEEQTRGAMSELWQDIVPAAANLYDEFQFLDTTLRKQCQERVLDSGLFPKQNRKSVYMDMTPGAYQKRFQSWIARVQTAWNKIGQYASAIEEPPQDFWQKFELCWYAIEEINRQGPVAVAAHKFEQAETNRVLMALQEIGKKGKQDQETDYEEQDDDDEQKQEEKPTESKKRKLPSWMTDIGSQAPREDKKEKEEKGEGKDAVEAEGKASQTISAPVPKLKVGRRKKAAEDEGEDDEEGDEQVSGESYFERNRAHSKQPLHIMRNVSGVTFAGQIGSSYRIYQPVWGTNIHVQAPNPIDTRDLSNPRVESLRLADFVVCSQPWQSGFIGLVHQKDEGVLRVDDDAVTTSQYWRGISDHFPVGGRFSVRANDLRVMHIVIEDLEGDKKKARGLLYVLEVYDKLQRRYFLQMPHVGEKLKSCFKAQDYPGAFQLLCYAIAQWVGGLQRENSAEMAKRIADLSIQDDPDTVFQAMCALSAVVLS
jgi:hypothetical protein